jgi:hypothetical protein
MSGGGETMPVLPNALAILVLAAASPGDLRVPMLHGPAAPVDVVLLTQMTNGPAGVSTILVRAKTGQLEHVAAAVRGFGGSVVSQYPPVQALTARFELRHLRVLLHHPAVAGVSAVGPIDRLHAGR